LEFSKLYMKKIKIKLGSNTNVSKTCLEVLASIRLALVIASVTKFEIIGQRNILLYTIVEPIILKLHCIIYHIGIRTHILVF
jgi:hypothetical protein